MKTRLAVRDLREALGIVKPAVNPRAPFVTLDTEIGEGVMVATDNHEVQIRTQVKEAWVPKAKNAHSAVAVPYRFLAELVGRLEEGDVELVASDTNVQVASGATNMMLPLAVDGTVPNRREPEAEEVAIDVVDWEAIYRVAQHVSLDENRAILRSVFFQESSAAASDDARLAFYEVDTGINSLVPANMITKVKDEEVDVVHFIADDRAVKITVGSTTSWGSPVQGTPPPWQKVVPTTTTHRIVFDAEAFKDAINRVQITARNLATGGRAITLRPLDEESLTLESQPEAAEVFGDCSEVVGLVDGELPWPMAFNSRHLTEAIDVMDTDKFEVRLTDGPNKPVLIGDGKFSIVLMPLNVL